MTARCPTTYVRSAVTSSSPAWLTRPKSLTEQLEQEEKSQVRVTHCVSDDTGTHDEQPSGYRNKRKTALIKSNLPPYSSFSLRITDILVAVFLVCIVDCTVSVLMSIVVPAGAVWMMRMRMRMILLRMFATVEHLMWWCTRSWCDR